MRKVLVAGAAGFIGSRVAELFLQSGLDVVGVDNLNDYYDARLKLWRLDGLNKHSGFRFELADIESSEALDEVFRRHSPEAVVNEAARAGVRPSIENPFIYMSTNATGCLNLLELCRKYGVRKYILASTSSIYAGQEMPFVEELAASRPISPYAASKVAAESLTYVYHYLFGIDAVVLRYFTVYGPAGRPDMSYFKFIWNIMAGRPIEVFGDGSQSRDFTYIDDVARGTADALDISGYEIINLGNNNPATLSRMISLIEEYVGARADVSYKDARKADMRATAADIKKATALLGWKPGVSLEDGIKRTVFWMKDNWHWLKDMSHSQE